MPEAIKRGIVVEGRGGQVRVQFENDDAISPWLDVMQGTTSGAQVFRRPKPGSLVVCALDRNWESGTVLGATYSDTNPPPRDSDDVLAIVCDDGSRIDVDTSSGAVDIALSTGFKLAWSGTDLTITGKVRIVDDLEVTGQTDLKATKINGITQVAN